MSPFTFTSLIPQGYKMNPAAPGEAEHGHTLYGTHTIEGGWCPNCDKPLLQLGVIDTRDPRLGLAHLPLLRIPLLFCTRCAICQADGDINTHGLQQLYQARHGGTA